ncbi:MAG: ABC transporter permease subunit [Candidatus Nanohaloarchaea archaeon]|nr:ABC transporter permease subunit [Candidatus Nanohaloarchaea archaeon]
MLEIASYEARKRIRGTLVLTVLLGLITAGYIAMYPSMAAELGQEQLNRLLAAYPEAVQEAFNVRSLATLEGFLAIELYTAGWILLVGFYMAYRAAGMIAGDVERGRTDMLLALPISRSRYVAEKFASLLVPITGINTGVAVIVIVAAELVGHPVNAVAVGMMHLLSVPYLLCCAAIGTMLSVLVDRASVAQRASLGLMFGLYMVNTLVTGRDYAWVGRFTPMRYLDPNAILLDHTYSLSSAGILLAVTGILLFAAQTWFSYRDIN